MVALIKRLRLSIKVKLREIWVDLCRFILRVMDFDFRAWLEEQANSDRLVEDRYSRYY